MRSIMRRQSTDTQDDKVNYKQLYLECKKNVALFMKHVDAQMSNILKKHELEKKKLEDEVERLRTELKDQNHNTSISFSKASSFQTQNKRNNSESKIYTQTSSISKETVEECLAKFSKIDYKPRETPQKRGDGSASFRQERKTIKSISEEEKENQVPSANLNEEIELGDLKLLSAAPRRDKRLKEKKMPESTEKVENIKDFLKDIRGRLSSRDKTGIRERQEPVVNIISPEMFSMQRNKV